MKCSITGLKAPLKLLMVMALAIVLAGCGSSKTNTGTSPDAGSKVDKPVTVSPEPSKKAETPSSDDFAKLLTTADVEQVSGYKGVKTVPYNPQIGAGGKLNFADESGKLVLAVMVENKTMLDSWKGNKDLKPTAVADLGDEAFQGGGSGMITPNVTFRKGERAIQLFTFFNFDDNMKPYLNHEQLLKLAKIVVGRM